MDNNNQQRFNMGAERRDFSSYRGGGRGRGRRGGRGGRFNRGRGRQNYSSNNNNFQRRSQPGNRFSAADGGDGTAAPVGKDQALLNTLLGMLHQVSELKGDNVAVEENKQDAAMDGDNVNGTTDNNQPDVNTDTASESATRPIMKKIAENIHKLALVVKTKPDVFFQNQTADESASVSPQDEAGPLATRLVHCIVNWPLHTPSFASLTLVLDVYNLPGFAQRVVKYASQLFAADLDRLLLPGSLQDDTPMRITLRLKLLLRFFTLLARDGVIQIASDTSNDTDGKVLTLVEFYNSLYTAIQNILNAPTSLPRGNRQYMNIAKLLTYLIWSNQVYIKDRPEFAPLVELHESFKTTSLFTPGTGPYAILLKQEQLEDVVGDNQDIQEDEDDDDDDGQGPICDNFQSLHQAVTKLMQDSSSVNTTRWTMFTDCPYKELNQPDASEGESGMDAGTEGDVSNNVSTEGPSSGANDSAKQLVFVGEPLLIEVLAYCNSLLILLNKPPLVEGQTIQLVDRADLLNGVIVGRLPLYGPAPDAGNDDADDEEEDEGDGDGETTRNVPERLKAYQTSYTTVERFFIGEAIRDCLISHESYITSAGVEQGSSKSVAEDIWSITKLMSSNSGTVGIEFAILENILSLALQSDTFCLPLRLVYLSRVILELTKLEPMLISSALAIAVSNLFQDYLPTLVPLARYRLSQWFSFHLINTDYQWPAGYWKFWEPFVQYGWLNSRGAFVKSVLSIMSENVSSPDIVVQNALPKDSLLTQHIVEKNANLPNFADEGSTLNQTIKSIEERIWSNREGVEMLGSYIVEEELPDVMSAELENQGSNAKKYWRLYIVMQSLLAPARRELMRLEKAIKESNNTNEDSMDATAVETDSDALFVLLDGLERYSTLITGVLAKDTEYVNNEEMGADGGVQSGKLFIVQLICASVSYSRVTLESCISKLLELSLCDAATIIQWSLTTTRDGKMECVRWWEIATIAVGSVLENNRKTASTFSNMEGESNDNEKSNVMVETVCTLVEGALGQVCQILSTLPPTQGGDGKLTALQVELVEGAKYMSRDAKALLMSGLEGRGMSYTDAVSLLESSKLDGPALVGLVSGWGNNDSVQQLIQRLERL